MPLDATKPTTTRPPASTLAYAQDRRAELLTLLPCKPRVIVPYDLKLRWMKAQTMAALNNFVGMVLP